MKRLALLMLALCCFSWSCTGKPSDDALDGGMTADGAGGPGPSRDAGPSTYCPAGTTLTPYLGDTRMTHFTMPDMVLKPMTDYFAVLETDVGRLVLALTADQTPKTVNSFVFLTRNHFYDGVAFHRVLEGFVAQGGDPNTVDLPPATWGTGGPGYQFGLELVNGLNFDARGVLGMARAMSPDTNGSQFFITLASQPGLDNNYTVFGKVSEGDGVLDLIKRGPMPDGVVTMAPTRMQTVHICEKSQ